MSRQIEDVRDDEGFTDFEKGERFALLQLRNFMCRVELDRKPRPLKEVDAFCAQRLHDIRMDMQHHTRTAKVGIPTSE